MSQPARAVWIEISICFECFSGSKSHSLRGLCGLKFACSGCTPCCRRHSLRGLCGLKYCNVCGASKVCWSQPARAVWIEIPYCLYFSTYTLSQPARAVWIEIWFNCLMTTYEWLVTACEGCVD